MSKSFRASDARRAATAERRENRKRRSAERAAERFAGLAERERDYPRSLRPVPLPSGEVRF